MTLVAFYARKEVIMKKISFVLALIFILGTVLTACGGRSYKAFEVDPNYQSGDSDGDTISFQDFEGNKLTVPKDVTSIVCFSPEAAIVIRGIGSQKYITAIDEETSNAVVNSNIIGIEDIASQNAQIIFIEDTYDVENELDGSVPYVKVPSNMTINDAKTLIKIVEKALNSKKDSLADSIDSQMTLAQSATSEYANKYPTFVDLGNFKTAGSGNYVSEIISVSGGDNVFGDREGFFEATKEEIIAANPTFIFTTSETTVYTRDIQLKQLDCVKEGRVIRIEPSKINYASQNIADVISTMFDAINTYNLAD